jgi:hypothetical protein
LTDSLTGVVIEQVAPIHLGTLPRSAARGLGGDGRTGACSVRERRDAFREAVSYAKATKGTLRGLQSGVAVIPALVAESVTEQASAAAAARPKKEFAALLLPAIVDLGNGQTLSYQGPIVWGAMYASWLRARLSAALPAPAPR